MLLSYVQKHALSIDLSNVCYSPPHPIPAHLSLPSSVLSKCGSACVPRCCTPLRSCPHCSLCALRSTASRVCVCVCLQLFMLFFMHAYGGRLWPSKQQQVQQEQEQQSVAESMLYTHVSWRRHWPCLVPWTILEAILSIAWLHNAVGESLNLSALLTVFQLFHDQAETVFLLKHRARVIASMLSLSGLAFGLFWQRSTEGSCMALVLTQLAWQQPCVNTSLQEHYQ